MVIFGSFLRPVGGTIADRIGGYRLLLVLPGGAAIWLGGITTMPTAYVALALFALTLAMDQTGGLYAGFAILTGVVAVGLAALFYLGRVWREQWD